jgi:hypothetical protein
MLMTLLGPLGQEHRIGVLLGHGSDLIAIAAPMAGHLGVWGATLWRRVGAGGVTVASQVPGGDGAVASTNTPRL